MPIEVSDLRGPLGELTNQFSGPNGAERFHGFKLWLKGAAARLLAFVCEVNAPAITRFDAATAFGPNNPEGIKFFLGENFRHIMLRKVEQNIPATKLAVHRLKQDTDDPEIMIALGRGKRIIKLAQLHAAIVGGQIPKDGSITIIAYIIGNDGNVWAVDAFWHSFTHEWRIHARYVADPRPWSQGPLILSQA